MALRCSGDSLKLAPLGLHRTAVQRKKPGGCEVRASAKSLSELRLLPRSGTDLDTIKGALP